MVPINTQNILFICGGAFSGIDKIISRRLNTNSLGFSKKSEKSAINRDNVYQYITPSDLKTFGLIPELIGRLPAITYLDPLDKETLRQILTEPKNAIIRQYEALFDMEHIKLTFQHEVYDFIVEKAIEYKLGARGLRTLCEAIMLDAMFDIPSGKTIKDFEITLSYAEEKLGQSGLQHLKVA